MTVTHLGYDTATDTVYSGAINISHPTTQTAKFTNTTTSGASSGAGMQGYSDDGAAMSSGDRLGFYALGGAKDASHTTANTSIIESFATENWSGTATGSNLVFSTTANTTTTRSAVLTLGQNKSATFSGSIIYSVRIITGGVINITNSDCVVVINKTVASISNVNLPSSPPTGLVLTIKDGKGDASTNNIILTPSTGGIDGSGAFTMNTNYGSVTIVYNGTDWNVI